MPKHQLSLIENAIDSLNEALRKYNEGVSGNTKAFKFAVLHFCHFIELLLKHHVASFHRLLIYKNPFSKKIQNENTIGAFEAVQFLKNEGHDFPDKFSKDLEWFVKLRNNIEHYEFSLDIDEVKAVLGRLMRALSELSKIENGLDLKKHVEPKLLSSFETLADEYKARLAAARERAEELSDSEFGYGCWDCGNYGTVSRNAGVYKCHFCGVETKETECCVCGEVIPEEGAITWNDDDPDHPAYICKGCHNHILNPD